MAFIVKGTPVEKPSIGNHNAVCFSVVDLKMHNETYNGKTRKVHKLAILWEIEEIYKKGFMQGQRFFVVKEYTVSFSKNAHLHKDISAWIGREFTDDEIETGIDIERLIGQSCLLTIAEDDRGYTKTTNIAPAVKKLTATRDVSYIPKWLEDKRNNGVEEGSEEAFSEPF